MAIVLPPFNPTAGIPQAVQLIAQQFQQRSQAQELAALAQQIQGGGQIDPTAFRNPQVAQLALGAIQQQQVPRPGFTLGPGQERFGPGGQPIAQVPAVPAAAQPFTLTPGARRFGAGGEQIAAAPAVAKPRATSFQQIPDPATGQITNALVDSQTGEIIKNFGTTGALSPKDKIQIAVTQAKEFRADPRIKNLQIIERSERGMQAALKQATSPNVKSRIASDQALGVLFQKMLDPESVVRESEFARTPEGAAAINQILAIAPQLRLGGLRLLDEDRNALAAMATKLLTEAKITANKAFSEFETRADEIGLNKKVVFGGAKPFDITGQVDRPQQQFQIGQTVLNNGVEMRITGFDTDGTPLGEPVR